MSKTVIVTGASRGFGSLPLYSNFSLTIAGIGLAVAKFLIQESHNVIVFARSVEPLEKLRNDHPNQVRTLAGDVNDLSLATKAVNIATTDFGGLDGIVINHGAIFGVNKVADCDIDEWREMFEINFFSAVAFVSLDMGRYWPASLMSRRPRQHYLHCVGARAPLFTPAQEQPQGYIALGGLTVPLNRP